MKTVLAAGTFDGVHKGHEFFLSEAKKHGDTLTVIVARDSSVERIKGRKPRHAEEQRLQAVQGLGIADTARLGKEGSIFDVLEELRPNVICLGYDQEVSERKLSDEMGRRGLEAKVVRLPAFEPKRYKSSLIGKDKESSQ